MHFISQETHLYHLCLPKNIFHQRQSMRIRSIRALCNHFTAVLQRCYCEIKNMLREWKSSNVYLSSSTVSLVEFNSLNISVSTLMNEEVKAHQNNTVHIIEILHSPLSINTNVDRVFSIMSGIKLLQESSE